jgi:hypothetical protein
MLNDLAFFTCTPQQNSSITDAKSVFGENLPYTIVRRLSGDIIIFSEHFINGIREAFTTGCMSLLTYDEELLLKKYITYQNTSIYRDITNDESAVLVELDAWLMREYRCEPQPIENECFTYTGYETCTQ